jgi:hypothetical protein
MCMSNSCGPTGSDRRPRSRLDTSAGTLSATRTAAPSTSTPWRNRSGCHGRMHRRHPRLDVTPPSRNRSNASHTSVSSNGHKTMQRSPHQARPEACPDPNSATPRQPCSSCTMRSSRRRRVSISNPRHSSNEWLAGSSQRQPHERSNQRSAAYADPGSTMHGVVVGPPSSMRTQPSCGAHLVGPRR